VSDAEDRKHARGDLDAEELAQIAARRKRNGEPYDETALNRKPVFFRPAACDSETTNGHHACQLDSGHHEDFHVVVFPGGSAVYWNDEGETWSV